MEKLACFVLTKAFALAACLDIQRNGKHKYIKPHKRDQ
jgi:hypothetical protein